MSKKAPSSDNLNTIFEHENIAKHQFVNVFDKRPNFIIPDEGYICLRNVYS